MKNPQRQNIIECAQSELASIQEDYDSGNITDTQYVQQTQNVENNMKIDLEELN